MKQSWESFRPSVWPTLREMQLKSCAKNYHKPVFGTFTSSGALHWTTYGEFGDTVNHMKQSLIGELGILKGDRVAVIGKNSLEWAQGAYGTYAAGGAYVPMYENQGPAEWQHVIEDSGAKVVFCANDKIRKELISLKEKHFLKDVNHILTHSEDWNRLLEFGGQSSLPDPSLGPDDLCGIIYTSGTSGKPKGVELTHANISVIRK